MEPKKPVDQVTDLIEASEGLIKNTVPVLDSSTHGWWRLAVLIVVIGGVSAVGVLIAKTDPNKLIEVQPVRPQGCVADQWQITCP